MSILSGSLFSGGSTRLHTPAHTHDRQQTLRKSKSHGGLLSPLVQLVRNPVGSLSHAVASYSSAPVTDPVGIQAARIQVLYLRMNNAETYHEWKAAATELDRREGHDAWKEDDASSEYDFSLVAQRLREMEEARISCDLKRMIFILRTSIGRNVGGMGRRRLYTHSHIGTKRLIERYIDSVQELLAAFVDVVQKQGENCPINIDTIATQMKYVRQSFGRSALLLSGGGTFGMNHIGVVKCLWDQGLLPRIISGASAGSIVCAVLCTKTDEEIPEVMHQFCHGDLDVFEKDGEPDSLISRIRRMVEKGSLFDIAHLERVMKGMLGNMTFKEAYHRTQRILNIPISTSSQFELPRLLNYITAPNVIIWSAVCTSCSVPVIYKKSTLLAKDPFTYEIIPWDPHPDYAFIDGSVDNDLPMARLAEMFSVDHFIVSQVNPHVVPFLATENDTLPTKEQPEDSLTAGPGWLNSGLNIAKDEVVHRMQVLADLNIFPNLFSKLRSVLNQRYSGDINIFPQISMIDLPKVLANPTPEYMQKAMMNGQRATWPKLARIENHIKIELAIDKALHALTDCQHFGSSSRTAQRASWSGSESNISGPLYRAHTTVSMRLTDLDSRLDLRNTRFPVSAPSTPSGSRAALAMTPVVPTVQPQPHPEARSPRSRSPIVRIMSPSTNEEGSSDRDYFAEVDSDTTNDMPSYSSPLLSPMEGHPTIFASVADRVPTPVATRPGTPLIMGTSASRQATMLSLNMTSTTASAPAPSSPERRYKRLFHPPGPVRPEESTWHAPDPEIYPTPYSRRGSLHEQPSFLVPEGSGTRGMLLRKKSSAQLAAMAAKKD